ncbi:ribosome silencing factor [Anaerofustis sp.]|uniref:ribosome silencing factor n=1 Tax=Anaerofustis sp. TaxID=1872517 RepID=UPI0025BC1D5B|nr:ribosome silencing factor [Anaerofustis sp.]
MDYKEKTKFFTDLLEEKKLTDIYAVDVTDLTAEANAFIIATAGSERQAKAVCEFVEEKAEEKGLYTTGKEGIQLSKWILLDYGDIVIHIFLREEREFYSLERLWQDGKIIKE